MFNDDVGTSLTLHDRHLGYYQCLMMMSALRLRSMTAISALLQIFSVDGSFSVQATTSPALAPTYHPELTSGSFAACVHCDLRPQLATGNSVAHGPLDIADRDPSRPDRHPGFYQLRKKKSIQSCRKVK